MLLTSDSGLSPLARGTPPVEERIPRLTRFIPAGAGNTFSPVSVPVNAAVYPRWRGEHLNRRRMAVFFAGLSPLARGTHIHHI